MTGGVEGEPRQKPDSGLFSGVARHTAVYGLGMMISRAVSFLMLPIYLRYLNADDYGVMFLVDMTLDFIAIVGGAQLALGVFRFYHKTESASTKQEVVSTSFALVALLYTAAGAATWLSAAALSRVIFGDEAQRLVIQIAAAGLATSGLLIVPMAYTRVRDLSHIYVSATVGKLLVQVVMNIVFIVVMELGVIGIFLGTLTANVVVGSVMSIWLLRRVGGRVSLHWCRDLLGYGIPLMGMQAATFIATFADRYFLQALADPGLVGLYGLAYQFGFLMLAVGFSPVEMVWGPKRFDVMKGETPDRSLAQGFKFINIILFTTGVGIVLYVEDVLRIIADPEFHAAARVVPLILFAHVFHGWSKTQDIGILFREKTKYLTLANFASAFVAVLGYSILIPRYLEWGAATATVIAFATRWVLTYSFSQRLLHIDYRWYPNLIVVLWAVGISSISIALPTTTIMLSLFIRTVLLSIYFAGLWFLPVLDDGERSMASSVIGRIAGEARSRIRPGR